MSEMDPRFSKNVATVGSELRSLLGVQWKDASIFNWPPDGFAVCGWLLECTGAYSCVLNEWPPRTLSLDKWKSEIENVAKELRAHAFELLRGKVCTVPTAIESAWSKFAVHEEAPLNNLPNEAKIILLELLAITDEACVGFGLPELEGGTDRNDPKGYIQGLSPLQYVALKLQEWRTFTPRFAQTTLSVLPKQHTPLSGITLRSMSHHLALFTGGEVASIWFSPTQNIEDRLNLLVIPWPFAVAPSQFSEASCPGVKFAEGFGCFDYRISSFDESVGNPQKNTAESSPFETWLRAVFHGAALQHGRIHGVVLPEAALVPDDFKILDRVATEFDAFVVSGVGTPLNESCSNQKNEVWMTFGYDEARIDRAIRQSKHHRWKLDKDQILMYGLAGSLDPNGAWWENIEIGNRDLHFISLRPQLTICCLICEDLARQDPVASLVRAVGPNLVIALLSDGPQLSKRWSARYATVLADDPGSSVLTVTGFGMTKLSEPPPGEKRSRVVALWKDALKGLKEITLEEGSVGVVLNLWLTTMTETSADGRDDGGVAAWPALGGVHQIRLPALAGP